MTASGLTRSERLRGREAIRRLLKEARSVENNLLVVRHLRGDRTERRVLFSVARSIRGAVPRNRLKRRLRALYRDHRDRLPMEGDLLLMARTEALGASWNEMTRAFLELTDALAD
jgi:ribonuclease P protein component